MGSVLRCPLHSGGEIGTPNTAGIGFVDRTKSQSNQKGKCNKLFQICSISKGRSYFFVLCIVLNLTKDSFVKSFSLLQVLSILLHLKNAN